MSYDIDVAKAKQAQKKYCEENEMIHFAPDEGFCFRCGQQIYMKITVDYASKNMITECPWCHASFVE